MELFDKINEDIKTAMKSKEKDRLEALRYLKSLFLKNKTDLNPIAEFDILVSHVKKLNDSLSMYPDGNDIKEKLIVEIKVLEEYLPSKLSEAEVKKMIEEQIQANPGVQMGIIMKSITPQIKGRFDGKRASEMVKELLA